MSGEVVCARPVYVLFSTLRKYMGWRTHDFTARGYIEADRGFAA
jgi:hypothetical protein